MQDRRGILNPAEGERHFRLERYAATGELAHFIERYWLIRWDLRGRAPFRQETLPFPAINIALERGRSAIHGVTTTRFEALLEDEGSVVGIKFRPGGFYPFVQLPMRDLTDRVLPLPALLGESSARLEDDVLALADDRARIARVEEFFIGLHPRRDSDAEHVARIVDLAQREPLRNADELACRVELPLRTLQRLFQRYVGVGAKWVLRRFRIHEAAERLRGGARVDLSRLAQELGYFDQAHFSKDFRAQVGRAPAEYLAMVRAAPTQGG